MAAIGLVGCWFAPAQAAADELTVADATGDVWFHDGRETFPEPKQVSPAANADVLSTRLRHGFRRVMIEARYTDLVRGRRNVGFGSALLTDAGRTTYWVEMNIGPGYRSGTTSWSREDMNGATCPSLRHAVSYEDDVMRVSFARSCVDRPQWVQFDLGAGAEYADTDHAYFWWDDPQTEEHDSIYLSVPLWRATR